MNYIYVLICPIENKIRYVGKSKNPKTRYKQHLKDAEKKQNTKKQKWIRELKSKKLYPIIKIIDKEENEEKARILEEKNVIKNIDTIFNIHMPGRGSLSVAHFRDTGKLKEG